LLAINLPDGTNAGDWCVVINNDQDNPLEVDCTGGPFSVVQNFGMRLQWDGAAWSDAQDF